MGIRPTTSTVEFVRLVPTRRTVPASGACEGDAWETHIERT